MATFTAARAASTFPIFQPPHGSGVLCCAWGTIEVAANPVAADFYALLKLPKGATVHGGVLTSDDLDTNATETLDLDIGWLANGVDAADPDGFGNLGVMGADTVAGVKPESGYQFPLGGRFITDGPITFGADTTVGVTCVATAATFAAGTLTLRIYYTTP
ncbi:MAG: hypothetical protein NT113_07045 [Hyphomicrobiales bacterium]|nr:hypothetical protein [Hyphomicrobiales bacterium]